MVSLIDWWENKLTSEERTDLMKGYSWHGTIEERHKKLKEMYDDWKIKQN